MLTHVAPHEGPSSVRRERAQEGLNGVVVAPVAAAAVQPRSEQQRAPMCMCIAADKPAWLCCRTFVKRTDHKQKQSYSCSSVAVLSVTRDALPGCCGTADSEAKHYLSPRQPATLRGGCLGLRLLFKPECNSPLSFCNQGCPPWLLRNCGF